jgi:5-methylcytosine-specific restriction endonuclease McrA
LIEHKTCKACSAQLPLESFAKSNGGKFGRTHTCRKCVAKNRLENLESVRAKEREYDRTPRGRYHTAKSSIAKRGIDFNISLEWYENFCLENKICFYCDEDMANTPVGLGLNRIDSNKGYSEDNLKRCCKKCNSIMNNYSINDLKTRVFKIVKRMEKIVESKVRIYRQSGLPPSLENYTKYQEDYIKMAELISDRAGLDMEKSQRMYRFTEYLLKKKHDSVVEIELPQSKEEAMELIKKFGTPITFAITADGNDVLGLILDELQ